ncbi:hypothetical protein K435DRAFT_858352 [Dendrothele bispora CBS 962.96]|uniref:SAM domain-containing protein n=1 Tax=Dendrothele bispora (strain CBS 962.96) TaxID=1314807 RepID=A0A4S8M3C2_DENBC|nr:hypothetical protein K435DRAFT_858352 [Dendrothele bispora CBS 962.96]
MSDSDEEYFGPRNGLMHSPSPGRYFEGGEFDIDEEEYEQFRAEEEERAYQEALAELIPVLQPIFPPLKTGEKRRANSAKPVPVQSEPLYIHEASCLQDFLNPVIAALQGKGNLPENLTLSYILVAGRIRSKTFKITWKLTRGGDGPLQSTSGYSDMIDQAVKKKTPELKITLEELPQPETPDEAQEDETGSSSKRQKKKEHVPSAEEQQVQRWIEKLQAKHKCQDAKCNAGGAATCLVRGEKHLHLTPQNLRYWASAICDHQEGVDDENPPNTPEFQDNNTDIGDIALLSARRKKALEQSQVHNINVNIGGFDEFKSEMRNLIQGRDHSSPEIPSASRSRQSSCTPSVPPLPPPTSAARLDLSESDIKIKYKLKDKTVEKLLNADISGLHALAHITDQDLKDAGLSVGERADVRWAEDAWRNGLL